MGYSWGKELQSECGRWCPLLPFLLSVPGEQWDIFGILFEIAGRDYQVSFHLLVLICGADRAITVNYKTESCVARSKGRDDAVLRSWGMPVANCVFTTKPVLPQLLSASDLLT